MVANQSGMRLRIAFTFAGLISLECAALGDPPFFSVNGSTVNALQSVIESTVPANGDLNPYGLAFVPANFPHGGTIAAGDLLVSNFNNSSNVQGTGTTIVKISPNGTEAVFATSKLMGVDTALGVLAHGFVMVGNLPNSGGSIGQGALQIFDKNGAVVMTLTDASLLDGPWDLTISERDSSALVFVSNVLNGTVTRLNFTFSNGGITLASKTQIGSGYGHQPNSSALVVGPTGLAYDADRDTLYVASTADNTIFGIGDAASRTSSAGQGFTVFADQNRLHGPLALTFAANGDLIAANGDAVNSGGTQNSLVEFTRQGTLAATHQIDGGAPGACFGITSTSTGGTFQFAAVDDDLNAVTIWTLRSPFGGGGGSPSGDNR